MSFQTSNKFAAFILAKLSCLGSPSKEKKKPFLRRLNNISSNIMALR